MGGAAYASRCGAVIRHIDVVMEKMYAYPGDLYAKYVRSFLALHKKHPFFGDPTLEPTLREVLKQFDSLEESKTSIWQGLQRFAKDARIVPKDAEHLYYQIEESLFDSDKVLNYKIDSLIQSFERIRDLAAVHRRRALEVGQVAVVEGIDQIERELYEAFRERIDIATRNDQLIRVRVLTEFGILPNSAK